MKQQNRTKIIVAIFLLAIALSVATVALLSVLEIRAHKHEYTVSVVAPTCVDGGYTLHTCVCGNSYKDEFVDALGHDFAEEFTVDEEPDCTAAGSKSKHCSRCESTAEVTVIPANSLKTIIYSGTALQWVYVVKNKYIGPWDFDLPKDYRVICSNGKLLKDGTVLPLE